jgi:hypothetical protein
MIIRQRSVTKVDELGSVLVLTGGALCAGVLALVLFSRPVTPQSLTCAKVRVPGGRERALRARYATGALRGLGVLPLVMIGAVGVGLGAGVADIRPSAQRVGWALVLAAAVMAAYRSRGGAARFHYLALAAPGVVLRPARFRAFIPWQAVHDVRVVGTSVDTAQMALVLVKPDAASAGLLDRLAMRFRRPGQVDIAVDLRDLDVDPRAVVHAFGYYLDRPERRADLGTPAELQHLLAVQRKEL